MAFIVAYNNTDAARNYAAGEIDARDFGALDGSDLQVQADLAAVILLQPSFDASKMGVRPSAVAAAAKVASLNGTVFTPPPAIAQATQLLAYRANTFYKAGSFVVNPAGAVVAVIADFVSGASYDMTKFTTPTAADGSGFLSTSAASASFQPLGGLSNGSSATAVAAKLATIRSGTAAQLRFCITGSSVAGFKYNEYFSEVAQSVGGYVGTIGAAGGSNAGSPNSSTGLNTNSSSGTITDSTTDFATWWSGLTTTLGVGSSRVYGHGGGAGIFDSVEVMYFGGTGVIGVQVAAGAVTNIDTSLIPAGQVGFYSATTTRAGQTLTLSAVSGTPKYATNGVGLFDSTVGGFMPLSVAQGGISLTSATTNAWTNYSLYLAKYLPDLITWEMKSGQWTQAALTTMLNAIQAGAPNCDVLLIGSTPDSGGAASNAGQQAQNEIARTTALTFKAAGLNVLYFDGFTPLTSYARVVALGWQGDGTHLAWQAQAHLAGLMLRDIGYNQETAASNGRPFSTTRGMISSVLSFGTNLANICAQIVTDPNGNDFSLRVKRWTRGLTIDGLTEAWRLDNVGGGTSFLPNYFAVGFGNPAIAGNSATELGIRIGSVYKSLRLRRLVLDRTAITTSGAIVVDLSNFGAYEYTLNGNITALSFSNPGTSGELFIVDFIQDATGSRTLSGANASIRWAGGVAPTLTTTAGRRDSFTFRQIGGSYVETSRSMNVG